MTTALLASATAIAAAFAIAGFGFGVVYFTALRRTVDLYGAGRGVVVPTALTLFRLAAAILFLGFAARFGALPLLAAFLAFLLARSLALRAARRIA